MRLRITVLLFVVAFATILYAQGESSAAAPNLNEQEALLALQPEQSKAQALAFYDAETLYKYMDGGADAFLLYDFRQLLHQDFRDEQVDVSLDIFDMATPENAFGMYASERSPSYHYIAVGAEGYDNEGILNFLQGPYYVKLAGFGEGANTVLADLANSISAKINGGTSLPAELSVLPKTNRKARSEQFLLKDPLGHPFLSPSYLARYEVNGKESTLLISIARDPAEAQERLKRLASHFKASGKCQAATGYGEGAIRASNSFEGSVLASTKDRYLMMLVNTTAETESVLKEAVQALR